MYDLILHCMLNYGVVIDMVISQYDATLHSTFTYVGPYTTGLENIFHLA